MSGPFSAGISGLQSFQQARYGLNRPAEDITGNGWGNIYFFGDLRPS